MSGRFTHILYSRCMAWSSMEVYRIGMYNGIIMSFSSIMAPVYEKMFKITHINKNDAGTEDGR